MIHAVVLAAGLGTRMRSPLAKVLHPLLGRSMVGWVVEALRPLNANIIVVVGHQAEAVQAAFAGDTSVHFAVQSAPLGTGHAVQSALPFLPDTGPVMVLSGDTPLLQTAQLQRLIDAHQGHITLASFEVPSPTGYGRIVREGGLRIVEQNDCSPEQAAIREVNAGAYVFDAALLHQRLPQLAAHPPKNEYYLTDLIDPASVVVGGFEAAAFMGVNDRAALAEARQLLRQRINREWALKGVDFEDLSSVSIDASVVLEPDAHLGQGVIVMGKSHIAGKVGPYCVLSDTLVEKGAIIKAGTVAEGAQVRGKAQVGPMAHLRSGAQLSAESRVGNFVEVKNAEIGQGAKVSHLSYIGDARIGAEANIGAGTITCNYDGFRKNHTQIGARAFIGSNTSLVAPVSVGDGAITGAGSTITEDVPADAVAVGRAPLQIRAGAAPRLRMRLKTLSGKT